MVDGHQAGAVAPGLGPGDELQVLGPLVARHDGREIPFGSTRRAAVLARLAATNQSVPAARLAEDVWGSADESVLGAVRVTVNRLRGVLGREAITNDSLGYRLRRDLVPVDADRFEALLGVAQHEALTVRLAKLDDALALWRGPAFGGLTDVEVVGSLAARLDDLREYALDERWAVRLRLGAGAELVAELEAAVRAAPLREQRCAALVTALYRAGRQSDALGVLRRLELHLRDELGVSLSPELRQLERQVLNHDRALSHDSTATSATAHGEIEANRRAALALARMSALDPARRLIAAAVAEAREANDDELLCNSLVDSMRIASMAGEADCSVDPAIGRAQLAEAEAIARRHGEGALLSRVAIARFGCGIGGDVERQLVQLTEPLDRLPRRAPERLDLLSASTTLATVAEDLVLAERLLRETAAIAAELDDDRSRAMRGVVACFVGSRNGASVAELEACSLRALEDAMASDDSVLIAGAMHARIVATSRAGDLEEIARLGAAMGDLGREALLPFTVQRERLVRNAVALAEGRVEGLLDAIDAAAATGARMGTVENGSFLAQRSLVMWELGQHRVLTTLMAASFEAHEPRLQLAEVAAVSVRAELGVEPVDADVARLAARLADGATVIQSEVVAALAAELAWWTRSAELAEAAASRLPDDDARCLVVGLGSVLFGAAGTYRALCDTVCGRHDAAIARLDARVADSGGRRPALHDERARWYLVAALRARGAPDDLRGAAEVVARTSTLTARSVLVARRAEAFASAIA